MTRLYIYYIYIYVKQRILGRNSFTRCNCQRSYERVGHIELLPTADSYSWVMQRARYDKTLRFERQKGEFAESEGTSDHPWYLWALGYEFSVTIGVPSNLICWSSSSCQSRTDLDTSGERLSIINQAVYSHPHDDYKVNPSRD